MLIVMDMSTGERLEETGGYDEEILYAGWLPQPSVELGLQSVVEAGRGPRYQEPRDVEAVLRSFYLAQQ